MNAAQHETHDALSLAALDALVDTHMFRHKAVGAVQIGDRVWHEGTRRLERVMGRSRVDDDGMRQLTFEIDGSRPNGTMLYNSTARVLVADDPADADWWNTHGDGKRPTPTAPANAFIEWLDNEIEADLVRAARVTAVRDAALATDRAELAGRADTLRTQIVEWDEGLVKLRRFLVGQR